MARFSPGAKAAALFEVSRGISRFGDVFGNLVRERQQEKRDAPFRAIQLQQAEQGVARGEREAVEAERLAGVRREYDEFKKKLASDDELRRLFEEDVKKGIEASKPEFDPTAGQPAFQETEGLPVQGPQEAPQAPPPVMSTEERLAKLEQFADLAPAQAQIKRIQRTQDVEAGQEFAREQAGIKRTQEVEDIETKNQFAADKQTIQNEFTAGRDRKQAALKRELAALAASNKQGNKIERKSTTTAAKIISDTGFTLGKFQILRNLVASGDVNILKVSPLGNFTNPILKDAILQLTELHGRKQSGAAISKKEWKNFQKQILDPRFLLTKKGQQAALDNLDAFIGRNFALGEETSSDPEWFERYRESVLRGIESVTGGGVATGEGEEGGQTFNTEAEARAAGKGAGDEIRITGVGLVRLD